MIKGPECKEQNCGKGCGMCG